MLGAACTLAGLAAAAGITLHAAAHERRSLEAQALALARSISFAAEREVSRTFARLEGLSAAPALRSGDLAAFRAQLEQTPAPPGLWFVVADGTGQILNTLLPDGDPRLPRNQGLSPPGMRTARVILEENRRYVGGAMWGPVAGIYTVAIGIPITLGPDGRRGALMASVPQPRMLDLLREQPLPSRWRAILVDQFSNVVARVEPAAVLGGLQPPQAWSRALRPEAEAGLFTAEDFAGAPVLVALAPSLTLGWTAVVEVPTEVLDAPLRIALQRIALAAIALLLLGLAGAWWLRSRIEGSLGALERAAEAADERQRLTEARFRHYWEHTPEGLFIVRVTPEGDFVFEGLNPAHERATGLGTAQIAGKRPEECLPPEVAAAVRRQYRRCVELGRPMRYHETLELPGGRRDWETSLAPMIDPETGQVTVVFGTARDVTDRVQAEIAARDSHALLQSSLDALSSQIVILDAVGQIVAVNAAWRRTAEVRGAASGTGPGVNYLAVCDAARATAADGGLVADGIRAVAQGDAVEFRHAYPCGSPVPGEERWFQLRVTRFGAGPGLRLVVAHEDITEVRRSADALEAAAGRMLTLQDDERRRIARELHDTTLQDLAAATIGIDAAGLLREQDVAAVSLAEARALLDKAARDVRTLSYLLHPPLLDECGLAEALAAYAEGFARRSGLECALHLDEAAAEAVPRPASVALFRVAQEAFANVRRHSGARSMRVHLRLLRGRSIELRVEDDGHGFRGSCPDGVGKAAAEEMRRLGVGIPGMRVRLGQLGGSLRIETGPDGTRVIASLPLDVAPESERRAPSTDVAGRRASACTERAAE